ncbi:MAG TPA: hypothetical protein PKA55_18130 [Rhodoblastus sp.]|nr:hypothetical protein [Rhodoblastus sp.]
MRALATLFLLLVLSGCMSVNESQMPDPAARGGGLAGGEPGGSPYEKPTR